MEFQPENTRPDHGRSVAGNLPGKKDGAILQKKNNTGLPDKLKTGVESLSGMSMDDVKVHYNSPRPSQLRALAYAQDTDIHIGAGQEKHLPHEAWHVVQQKQGRVRPTVQAKGIDINDDSGLEKEADQMGAKALQMKSACDSQEFSTPQSSGAGVVQRKLGFEFETGWTIKRNDIPLVKKTPIGHLKGNGWKAEADDNGRLEFIIYPPLQITDKLDDRINAIFDEIDAFCNALQTQAVANRTLVPGQEGSDDGNEEIADENVQAEEQEVNPTDVMEDIGIQKDIEEPEEQKEDSGNDEEDYDYREYTYNSFPLSLVTGKLADLFLAVFPGDNEIAAHAQITTGFSLDQLTKLDQPVVDDDSNARFALETLQGKMRPIKNRISGNLGPYGLQGEASSPLKGLLILTASYLAGGNQIAPLEYVKELTDGFMLSRTEVSKLFTLLPDRTEKEHFTARPDLFEDLVLATAGLTGTGATRLITPGIQGALAPTPFGPTRSAWLRGITHGQDLMSRAQHNDYESMGELIEKTELVGTESGNLFKPGGIFEIRAGQTIALPYLSWRSYALDVAKYIKTLQRDNSGFLKTIK